MNVKFPLIITKNLFSKLLPYTLISKCEVHPF